ncbi:hypothetical protein ACFX13_044445 [Malus domestica]
MAPNTFIFKLSDECAKCRDFIDWSIIKTLRFECDLSASHQILGRLFKNNVPASITNLLKYNCLEPLLQGYDWSKWELTKPRGAWPSTTEAWVAWVERMEKFFRKEWKILGIYDAIKLSTIEITMDKELLMAALGFWCSATNNMVLLFGLIGPTILNISAIIEDFPFRSPYRRLPPWVPIQPRPQDTLQ